MERSGCAAALAVIAAGAATVIGAILIFMSGWNATLVPLLHAPALGFDQAFWLLMMVAVVSFVWGVFSVTPTSPSKDSSMRNQQPRHREPYDSHAYFIVPILVVLAVTTVYITAVIIAMQR